MSKIITKEKFNKLLRRIGHENRRALEELYDIYGRLIYVSAFSICKSAMIADEVVDDVLVTVWQLAKNRKIAVENPEGWIYTISVNAAKNKIERETLPLHEDIASNQDDTGKLLSDDAFYEYISQLTEEERQIFIYRFIQDLKFSEIADRLQTPLSSVTSKYYRALKKIKEKLQARFG